MAVSALEEVMEERFTGYMVHSHQVVQERLDLKGSCELRPEGGE